MEQSRDVSVPSLREALRRARAESAERSGVLVELRTVELARLDLLKEKLEPVFAQVPDEVDLFDAAILPGDPARLFVDVLGFVEMGRDKRTYRFFQDSRYGRKLIAETDSLPGMTQAITDYVARRMVEREKALISDIGPQAATVAETYASDAEETPRKVKGGVSSLLLMLILGIGVALLSFWGAGVLWDAGIR
ncbi:hypothetical protein [Flaviflagellibacter deserti]|uniref:Uncharacterized protein n=1 Tax=Flaviflagellibacter deserti TaxID=2267266 RepID=A0ABV9YZJ8_9HYPH